MSKQSKYASPVGYSSTAPDAIGTIDEIGAIGSSSDSSAAISVRHISAGYSGEDVLHDISFDIKEGRNVCFLGANGCGKTTLLKVLCGLIPYHTADNDSAAGNLQSAGAGFADSHTFSHEGIRIFGQDLSSMKRRDIASQMAMLQQFSQAYFSYTVYETVMQGRYQHIASSRRAGLFPASATRQDHEAVRAILERTGLTHLADRQITQLSGGQQQRVYVARALAQDTPLLLLDEPTNHMDLKYQAELTQYLQDWSHSSCMESHEHGENGPQTPSLRSKTLVGVFHDVALALQLADDILVLKDGRVLAFGSKQDLPLRELLTDAYGLDVVAHLLKQNEMLEELM